MSTDAPVKESNGVSMPHWFWALLISLVAWATFMTARVEAANAKIDMLDARFGRLVDRVDKVMDAKAKP